MQPVMQLVVTARVAVWLATAWVVMQLRKHCHMIRAGGGGGAEQGGAGSSNACSGGSGSNDTLISMAGAEEGVAGVVAPSHPGHIAATMMSDANRAGCVHPGSEPQQTGAEAAAPSSSD